MSRCPLVGENVKNTSIPRKLHRLTTSVLNTHRQQFQNNSQDGCRLSQINKFHHEVYTSPSRTLALVCNDQKQLLFQPHP
jgi:hypothetical protein